MIKTNLGHYGPKQNKFYGMYRAVVENNNDPDMLGRIKARIWGIHTDDLTDSPVGNLPWAEPCLGLIEGSVSGYGMFSVPLPGSHVFVFFEDGNWECPRYFATAPGKPADPPDTSMGFNDPTGSLPRQDRLGESDFHRLARGEITETVIEHRNDNLDKGVPTADNQTWDEPPSAYAAKYPNNIVLTTHRGLTIEIDSTEGEERLHVFHPSNSYIEIDKDGNLVFRNAKDRFEITRGNKNVHVGIDHNETVNMDKTVYVGQNETYRVGNDRRDMVGNDIENSVGRNMTEFVGNDWKISCGGNIDIEAVGNIKIQGARIDLNPGTGVVVPGYPPGMPLEDIVGTFYEDWIPSEEDPPEYTTEAIIYGSMVGVDITAPMEPIGDEVESAPPPPEVQPPPPPTDNEMPTDCSGIPSVGIDYNMQLSTNFRLKDLLVNERVIVSQRGGRDLTLHTVPEIICNLRMLCIHVLEPITRQFGRPTISSGYRTFGRVKASKETSVHHIGCAVDMNWNKLGWGIDEYFQAAIWIRDNIPTYQQLILEKNNSRWIHIGYRDGFNNKQAFTMVSHRTYSSVLKKV